MLKFSTLVADAARQLRREDNYYFTKDTPLSLFLRNTFS